MRQKKDKYQAYLHSFKASTNTLKNSQTIQEPKRNKFFTSHQLLRKLMPNLIISHILINQSTKKSKTIEPS